MYHPGSHLGGGGQLANQLLILVDLDQGVVEMLRVALSQLDDRIDPGGFEQV